MGRLTRDRMVELVFSRDQILRRERGQRNINFPCSADHEQDWQPYPVDPYSAICYDHDDHQNIQLVESYVVFVVAVSRGFVLYSTLVLYNISIVA